jgi:FeS assembly SUF system protein
MSDGPAQLRERIISAIRTVFDPEIPVNVYDLGLIYRIDVTELGGVAIRMTLTSPNCPVADKLPAEVQHQVLKIPGVTDAKVELVFDPPWSREMMSEIAQLELEMMGISAPDHLHKSKVTNVTISRTARPNT